MGCAFLTGDSSFSFSRSSLASGSVDNNVIPVTQSAQMGAPANHGVSIVPTALF